MHYCQTENSMASTISWDSRYEQINVFCLFFQFVNCELLLVYGLLEKFF